MIARHHARLLARVPAPADVTGGCVGTFAVAAAVAPPASAASRPEVQVVGARGTGEQPGVGPTGQAFVDAMGSHLGDKSMDVYAVDYPAPDQWATGVDGIRDAGAHVVDTANTCPDTRLVLGGYSQGAAVMGFVTSAEGPDGVDPATGPNPLYPAAAANAPEGLRSGVADVPG